MVLTCIANATTIHTCTVTTCTTTCITTTTTIPLIPLLLLIKPVEQLVLLLLQPVRNAEPAFHSTVKNYNYLYFLCLTFWYWPPPIHRGRKCIINSRFISFKIRKEMFVLISTILLYYSYLNLVK